MTKFKQDDEETPVLFRLSAGEKWSKRHGRAMPCWRSAYLTAVFPTIPGSVSDPYSMSCYARVGQHSSCSWEWYRETRPAKPEDYASLKRELESAPYGYRLKVCHRITPQMRNELRKAAA
jgi:hypothetical protein